MTGTSLLSTELKAEVIMLSKRWQELNSAYENFARQKIEFAQEIKRIWDQAQSLDNKTGSEVNKEYFRDQLREFIQSDNKSILSKWVGIGSNAKELLPFANSLPSQRDSLYALSTAINKKKSIKRWIESGKLSSESTVREVQALSSPKKVKKNAANKQRYITVTFEISGSFKSAAELLSHIIEKKAVISVSSDKALRSALAQELGKERFDNVSSKVK